MNIQYYGDFCFKISTKPAGRATEDVVMWTDPVQKSSGLRPPQGQADIVLLSHQPSEMLLDTFKEATLLLHAPGEYAVKGISALGFASYRDTQMGAERGQNTIFIFESEELHICYLGALGHDLTPDILDKLAGSDILFLPIGGGETLEVATAVELARKIEPKIIIPMHYKIPGLTLAVETQQVFCDAIGTCPSEAINKLNVKKKDLEGKSMEIVLLERGV
ncbi:MAG: MBL fold metallo-hydrolase [Minisyncoccota bacterium]